jgi:hypothetical protein
MGQRGKRNGVFLASRVIVTLLLKGLQRYFRHEFEDELKIYRKRNELRKAGKKMAKDLTSAEKVKVL